MEREPEKHELAIQTAKKEIELSEHFIYVTYPSIADLKFLLNITDHITKAAKAALEALLAYERYYKRIDPYASAFSSKIDLFREQLLKKYNFDINHYQLLKRLRQLQKADRESVIRFKRNEKYWLTTDSYDTESVDLDDIKAFLRLSKSFIAKVDQILNRDE